MLSDNEMLVGYRACKATRKELQVPVPMSILMSDPATPSEMHSNVGLLAGAIAHAHLLIGVFEEIQALIFHLPDPGPQLLDALIRGIAFAAQCCFGLGDHHVDELQLVDLRAQRVVVAEELVIGGWGLEVAITVGITIAVDA